MSATVLFRWGGTEYVVDRGYAPRERWLDSLDLPVVGSMPDALVWDDVSVDFYARQRRLRFVRVEAPLADQRLQAQIGGDGRVAVSAERLRKLVDDGSLAGGAGPRDALSWLRAHDPGAIVRVSGYCRFVGPAFAQRPDANAVPSPPNTASSICVILNYRDHAGVTIACLEHLARQVLTAELEVLVVDNRSSAEERAHVDAALSRLFPASAKHLRYDAPFNLSYQNNFAAAQSTADVLLLLNNDCYLLDAHCLQTLANWAMTPGVGSVAPRMVGKGGRLVTAGVNAGVDRATGQKRIWECEYPSLSRVVRWTAANSTACAAINRQAWFDVGGMDACFFPSQYDDADLCLRMGRRGWKHVYVGNVSVFHEPGTTEERKQAEIARLMRELLERHDVMEAAAETTAFEVLKKVPRLVNDDARAWREFLVCFRLATTWQESSAPEPPVAGSEDLRKAWSELERLSDAPGRMPGGTAECDTWYQADQCRLMLQSIRVCRAFLEYRGEGEEATVKALDAVEAYLRRESVST